MKTLLLVRHAKSSPGGADLEDFDRPLSERGKKDALVMAKRLVDRGLSIDAFVSSPAKRAFKTAVAFSAAYEKKKKDIILLPALYHASPESFFTVIQNLDNAIESVALFSHNPGITEFADQILADEVRIDNMPTCSIFAVQANVATWKGFKKAKKTLLFFDFPKMEQTGA